MAEVKRLLDATRSLKHMPRCPVKLGAKRMAFTGALRHFSMAPAGHC